MEECLHGGENVSSKKTVYLNLRKCSEVRKKEIFLKDAASVYCSDPTIEHKCRAVKIKTIRDDRAQRYVESSLDVIRLLEQMDASIEVNNIGEAEFVLHYQPSKQPHMLWQWVKTLFVSLVCFFGSAFAIMTFNNDVSVSSVFQNIYLLIIGREAPGFTIMEISYSIGLAFGIVVFFNHFAKWNVTEDPTPLEVEMRLYEENVNKTVIQNDSRKEPEIDVL